jgi:signal transduction histidine kinase
VKTGCPFVYLTKIKRIFTHYILGRNIWKGNTMKGILTRLVKEAADQKHLTTMVIFLAAVAREILHQTWGLWTDPFVDALFGSLIMPAIVSLLVYAVLATFEKQQSLMREQDERLREAEQDRFALDTVLQMAATVQHEINNPLMIIKGNVDLVLNQDPANSRLKGIREAVERIRDVTTLLAQIKTVRIMVDSRERKMIDLEASVGEEQELLSQLNGFRKHEIAGKRDL